MRQNGRLVIVASRAGRLSNLREDLRAEFVSPQLTVSRLNDLMNQFIEDVRQGRSDEAGLLGASPSTHFIHK